jgi:prolyl oligopeptidase
VVRSGCSSTGFARLLVPPFVRRRRRRHFIIRMTKTSDNEKKQDEEEEDPYLWLEEVESERSLDFAKASNEECLAALGNPETSGTKTYQQVLSVLESDDRIPHVTQFGHHDDDANSPILVNFWKDSQNPKGLWRRTTLSSYKTTSPVWETLLDVDQLAEEDGISWVWKGSTPLPRARDSVGNQKRVTRALVKLSRGGSDAVHVKEFDLTTNEFVPDDPFHVPEAKTRVSYKSRDVLLVGTDFGPDSLTDSGYPRTVREWVRGTDLNDAPVVFEGDKKDVSVGMYVSDERVWGGGILEVRFRSLTFYTSKYWVRKLLPEHLLAPNDPARAGVVPEPPEFLELNIQEDADMSFLGNLMLISLRSDWTPAVDGGKTYKKGSLIYTNVDEFLDKGSAGVEYHVLFEPTDRTAYEYYTATKNYLILSTMDNVKSKLDFYKIGDGGTTLTLVEGASAQPRIRDCSVRPVDPYAGSDEFWFTTNDYVTPSTLFLSDSSKANGDGPDSFILEQIKSLPAQYDTGGLTVDQRFAASKDGTQIPYFIVHKKDMALEGKNPALLYGYGGFEVSLGPHYIASTGLAWLERGGVYVEANIRGGGEFGPSWHQAALKENRHKAYEDFIAVAEDLIATGICKPETLAIRGGSNVSSRVA